MRSPPGLLIRGLVALAVLVPATAGFGVTLAAAFGFFPALGFVVPSLAPWRALLAEPGLATSVCVTLRTGGLATLIALALAVTSTFHLQGHRAGRAVLAGLLAVPHAAMAVGLAFVLAPSGWIARALAPLAGWSLPPPSGLVGDRFGWALILGLVVKETPFLMLVMLAQLPRIGVAAQMAAGRSLGRPPAETWLLVILPQLWARLRLPVAVVAVYALSNVDMALILGPSTPPTLAVLVTRLYADPDLARVLPASAGALLQLAVVGAFLLALWLGARAIGVCGPWLRGARLGVLARGALVSGGLATAAILILAGLALAALVLWSVAWRWPWPELVPRRFSLLAWGHGDWQGPLADTLLLAVVSVLPCLAAALAWLAGGGGRRGVWVLSLPLVLPQIGFLVGLNALAARFGANGTVAAVAWGQAIFVLPYMLIVLADPWRLLRPAWAEAAATLGAGRLRRFRRVTLPLLARPVAAAAAIGVSVSVAQYLPTLFLGGGRVVTLTTEAVAQAAGSDRRVLAVTALLQAAIPFLAFAAAVLPARAVRRQPAK